MRLPMISDFQEQIGAHLQRGDLETAARLAMTCRSTLPRERTGWLLGSIVALLAGDKDTALHLIERRLADAPDDAQCLLQLAECLLALGRRPDALAAAGRASAAMGQVADGLDALGEFLSQAGEHRQAIAIYDRAIAADRRNLSLRAKRADLYRFVGDFERAEADYRAILAVNPVSPQPLKQLAELRRQSAEHNLIPAMHAALAAVPARSVDAAIIHFGLAKSYEDLADYASSWRHLTTANAIERERINYDAALDRSAIDSIMSAFSASRSTHATASDSRERPIFIVGIPRTGSTLIDRILGRHSAVHSAGEISALPDAIDCLLQKDITQPLAAGEFACKLASIAADALAEEYMRRVRWLRGTRPRFTDKLLTNFLYCALILRAFPQASIIHVTRHPLAACYAIFRNRFNGTNPYAYDLIEIAEFYIGYRRLMDFWHRQFPGRILDLAYEDVVKTLEPTTRRILDHLGLAHERACLEFHLNPDPVQTASVVQVRQPLYATSLDLWRHYAHELEPVQARLEEAGISTERF